MAQDVAVWNGGILYIRAGSRAGTGAIQGFDALNQSVETVASRISDAALTPSCLPTGAQPIHSGSRTNESMR